MMLAMSVLGPAQAVRLLAELVELDRQIRVRRQPLTLQQKQRRAQIAMDLHRWALARQRSTWSGGGEQRRDPRANVRLRVQLVGGPRPVELQSDSLAVGGMSLTLPFATRLGDRLHLELVPPPPDEPLAVEGEVIWFNAARQRVGVQFIGLDEAGRELLERLIFADLVGGE
jgi:PilZ domain